VWETLRWFVGARSTDGILWTLPATAPYDHFDTLIAEGEAVIFEDDFETDKGWTVGSPTDTATAGIWLRADPVESAVSPEDDHTPAGTLCYVTGGPQEDIDGGLTTVSSPLIDLASWADPRVDFWLYFRRDGLAQAVDQLRVEVSNDGGAQWTTMEVIRKVDGVSEAAWVHHSYRVADWLTPTATCRIRFRAGDSNLATAVKALLDDFRVTEELCACSIGNYCTSAPNSHGTAATMGSNGSASVSQNALTLTVAGGVPGSSGLFFYGAGQAQAPLADGTLCVGGGGLGILRLAPPIVLDAAGAGSRFVDLSAPPAAGGPGAILAGSTWNFQFWYRDPAGGPHGSNLSDGLEVTFCQ